MHHSFIVLVFAALLCVAWAADQSDCDSYERLRLTCSQAHLDFVNDNQDVLDALQDVSKLDDPIYLIIDNDFDAVCGKGEAEKIEHLRMYYECVFSNLTDCLLNANMTKITLPDPTTIAQGVKTLCGAHVDKAINASCINDHKVAVEKCFSTQLTTGKMECEVYNAMIECNEEHMLACRGGDSILNFVKDGTPQICGNSGTGSVTVPSTTLFVSLILSVVAALLWQ